MTSAAHSTRRRDLIAVAVAVLAFVMMTGAASVASAQTTDSPRTVVVGRLTLAEARWAGTDLRVSMGGLVSFMLPGDAGYMVYERNDMRGVRRFCIAKYGPEGMEFEMTVDLFHLDAYTYTPLDVLGLNILSAGQRVEVVDSRCIEVAGAQGLDLTVRGVYIDRQLPNEEARAVLLTDLVHGLMFTLVERQHRPEEHRKTLDQILQTLVFSTSWVKA